MTKKKEKELKPETKDIKKNSVGDLSGFDFNLDSSTDEETTDTYFKNVVDKLMNYDNPSTKTEYLNVNENFAGVKLEFLAEYGNIPILKKFVNIFEVKRISLERKGRIELIKALIERDKEMQRDREQQRMNLLLGGS